MSKSGLDLRGKKYGRLTAIEAMGKRTKSGSLIWRCQCECGNETEVSQSDLASGNTISCGCRKIENNRSIYKQLHMVDGTCIEFLEKRRSRSDNKTGHIGVSISKDRYRATIEFKGKRYHLGYYDTVEEATGARVNAERELYDPFLEEYYGRGKVYQVLKD